MGSVAMASWCTLRPRWQRVLLVVLFVGVVGALSVVTAAGARRTSSALDRFRQASRSADLEISGVATPEQLEALARVPGVAAITALRAYGLLLPSAPDFQQIGAPLDAAFGVSVDRDRIVAGRAADPSVVEEVTIGEGLASRLGLGVGDHLDARSFSPRQIAAILAGQAGVEAPAGPQPRLEVVGIVRRPLDLGDRAASGGLLVLTPAFAEAYDDEIGVFGLRIRIRVADDAEAADVLDASRRILGEDLLSAQDLSVENQGARAAIDLVAQALWVCMVVAALAGGIAIALVLAREVQLASADQERLGELGCTRWQRMAVVGSWGLPVALAGALLAAALAAVASSFFPIGVARRAEPTLGFRADVPALVLGSLSVAVLVLAVIVVAAHRSTRRVAASATSPSRPSWVADRVVAGLSASMTVGVRTALESPRRLPAVRARSGLFGAVAGALGVTVVLVLAATIDQLVATPRRFGATWELQTTDVTPNTPCGGDDFGLSDDPALMAMTELCVQNVRLDGRSVGAIAFTARRGAAIEPTVIAGRAPRTPGEVAVGAKALRALGKGLGDTVHAAGRVRELDFTIVGVAVLPTLGQAQPMGDGAVFTGEGYAPLYDQNLFTRAFVVRLAPGADQAALADRIVARPELTALVRPTVPVEVDRLRQIRWLPGTLALLLGTLALVAVGHALVTSVRRRRRELALLKSLGFTAQQVRASVAWQATTVGVVGLLVGIPTGVVVGLVVWRRLAADLGISPSTAVPMLALLLAIPCVLALVNLVAVLPARAAARTRPAVVLRSE